MSVPLLWNAAGLPIGAHFTARMTTRPTLLRLGGAAEKRSVFDGCRGSLDSLCFR